MCVNGWRGGGWGVNTCVKIARVHTYKRRHVHTCSDQYMKKVTREIGTGSLEHWWNQFGTSMTFMQMNLSLLLRAGHTCTLPNCWRLVVVLRIVRQGIRMASNQLLPFKRFWFRYMGTLRQADAHYLEIDLHSNSKSHFLALEWRRINSITQ